MSNVSAFGFVGNGTGAVVLGFVIGGTGTQTVLVRAVGPTLGSFGVTGFLTQPSLQLYDSHQNLIVSSTGLGGGSTFAADARTAGAFSLIAGAADSAALATLPPGAYSLIVTGANGTSGMALAEVYLDSANPLSQTAYLDNASYLADLTAGQSISLGFAIDSLAAGSGQNVLIRADGPALIPFLGASAISTPELNVVSGGTLIAQNLSWGSPINVPGEPTASSATTIAFDAKAVGAFPFTAGSADSAVRLTAPAGSNSVVVTGANGASGEVLVEVYKVGP